MFVFYDTETTGKNVFFSQILQFAAIKTDEDFNIIEEINLRCRLLPHILPHPEALVVTGVKPLSLQSANLSNYEMMKQISNLFDNWSPAKFIGYNSFYYDERVLRQAYYQNLLPIYQTQLNGNTRADVLRLAQMVQLFDPGAIEVPLKEDEKTPSFRLEDLSKANNINHGHAHDALSDVIATMELMKLIKHNSPQVYDSWLLASNKDMALERMKEVAFFKTSSLMGNPLKTHYATFLDCKANEAWLLYLDGEIENLLDADPEYMAKEIEKKKERTIVKFKITEQPVIMEAGKDLEDVAQKASKIKGNNIFIDKLHRALELITEKEYDNSYVEQQIYNGFYDRSDESLIQKFHEVLPQEKTSVVQQFSDNRLRALANRLICSEYSDHASPEMLEAYKKFLRERLYELDIKDVASIPTMEANIGQTLINFPGNEPITDEYKNLVKTKESLLDQNTL